MHLRLPPAPNTPPALLRAFWPSVGGTETPPRSFASLRAAIDAAERSGVFAVDGSITEELDYTARVPVAEKLGARWHLTRFVIELTPMTHRSTVVGHATLRVDPRRLPIPDDADPDRCAANLSLELANALALTLPMVTVRAVIAQEGIRGGGAAELLFKFDANLYDPIPGAERAAGAEVREAFDEALTAAMARSTWYAPDPDEAPAAPVVCAGKGCPA